MARLLPSKRWISAILAVALAAQAVTSSVLAAPCCRGDVPANFLCETNREKSSSERACCCRPAAPVGDRNCCADDEASRKDTAKRNAHAVAECRCTCCGEPDLPAMPTNNRLTPGLRDTLPIAQSSALHHFAALDPTAGLLLDPRSGDSLNTSARSVQVLCCIWLT